MSGQVGWAALWVCGVAGVRHCAYVGAWLRVCGFMGASLCGRVCVGLSPMVVRRAKVLSVLKATNSKAGMMQQSTIEYCIGVSSMVSRT